MFSKCVKYPVNHCHSGPGIINQFWFFPHDLTERFRRAPKNSFYGARTQPVLQCSKTNHLNLRSDCPSDPPDPVPYSPLHVANITYQIRHQIFDPEYVPELFPSSPLSEPPGTPFCSRSTRGRTRTAPPLFVCSTQPESKVGVKTSRGHQQTDIYSR